MFEGRDWMTRMLRIEKLDRVNRVVDFAQSATRSELGQNLDTLKRPGFTG
jgi:hypothetical protein